MYLRSFAMESDTRQLRISHSIKISYAKTSFRENVFLVFGLFACI